ncbi:MAG: C25 family cysteine peptidase [Blastocatellia bacterium]
MAPPGTAFFTIPPDTTGAVGTDAVNKVFGTLNNNYRVQNKTTGATIGSDVSMPNFWAAPLAIDPFDPRVQYDPYNDRWIVAGVSDAGTATTSILVGVSLTNDPSGAFALFKVPARIGGDSPPINFADFPMLGFNKNWVVVSINMFNGASGAFSDGRSLVLDYPTLRTGVLSGTYFTGVSAMNAGFCMHPATTYSATENIEYLVAHLGSAGATYRMHTITGTPGAPVFTLGVTKTRPGGGWTPPGGNILPQAMGTCATTPMNMDVGDAFIRNNVVFRDSSIWYPQTVGIPAGGLTHTAAQWTQLDTSGNVLQGGRVEDPTATATNGGKWYAYPSIAVNAADDVLLGFSEFSSAQFGSAGYTYRDHLDSLGTMRDPAIFKAGEDCYSKDFSTGRNRWGDYSHTMVDPTGDSNFWTIQEYAKLQAPPSLDGSTSKWGTWWAKVNALVPTAAKVNEFIAKSFDDGRALLQWRSGYEVDNLGYNVYREVNGERIKINLQIIAGSALVTGPNVALTAGKSYSWADQLNQGSISTRYWLEDIDLKGKSSWTGPININQKSGKAPTVDQSILLGKIGVAQSQMTLGQGSVAVERRAGIADLTPAAIQLQTDLAGQPAVKLGVRQEGWYRLTQPDLVIAGFSAKVDPRRLQLYVDGRPVPMLVNGEHDGRFDPSDSVEFFGVGINSTVTDSHVYWLATGSQAGTRIAAGRGTGQAPADKSFPFSVERKDRTLYFSALRNGEAENFFGPVIGSAPVEQSLSLTNLSPSPLGAASIEVAVQGVTATAHQVRVTLNGTTLGTVSFSGQAKAAESFAVPQSSLREGVNSLQLVSLGGSADISLADSARVTYWHSYRADSNQLQLTAQGGQQVTLSGFTSGGVRVMDVTDANNPQQLLTSAGLGKTGPGTLTVRVPGNGQRTLYAFASEQAKSATPKLNTPSNWRQAGRGADFVVLTRHDLMASLAPLAVLRQKDGLSVAVVDVEDVYDEFSFGNKTPQAIRDFLQYAKTNWQPGPRFVLMAGDASYDSKNYLGYGDADLVPTKLIDTRYLEAASDDWFSDFNDDGSPELAMGRLPVRNPSEAAAMVTKIAGYDTSRVVNSILLASDSTDGFDFAAANNLVRPFIPAGTVVTEVRRGSADDAIVKAQLLAAINKGARVVSYNGHGSMNQWRGSILTSDDARSLTNGQSLSLFVLMTCLNGYFDDPVAESLSESLLKASKGGAVAVWASTAQADPSAQSVMNQAFHRELFGAEPLTVGEAASRAKSAVTDRDVRRTWILFGDPAMRFN